MHLRLSRGISIGGTRFSRYAQKLRSFGISDEPYAALLASRPEPFPELLLVYSVNYAHDAEAAAALHEMLPSRLLGVKDCDGHLVLAQKLAHGTLPIFLAKILGQDLERNAARAETAFPQPELRDSP